MIFNSCNLTLRFEPVFARGKSGVSYWGQVIAIFIRSDITGEAIDSDAKVIVTTCPTSKWNLEDSMSSSNENVYVMDLSALAAKALS